MTDILVSPIAQMTRNCIDRIEVQSTLLDAEVYSAILVESSHLKFLSTEFSAIFLCLSGLRSVVLSFSGLLLSFLETGKQRLNFVIDQCWCVV